MWLRKNRCQNPEMERSRLFKRQKKQCGWGVGNKGEAGQQGNEHVGLARMADFSGYKEKALGDFKPRYGRDCTTL